MGFDLCFFKTKCVTLPPRALHFTIVVLSDFMELSIHVLDINGRRVHCSRSNSDFEIKNSNHCVAMLAYSYLYTIAQFTLTLKVEFLRMY